MQRFDPNLLCPHFKTKCKKHKCTHYVFIRGIDPQTEEIIDQYGCSLVFGIVAQLENNKLINQLSADMQTFRNTVARGQVATVKLLAHHGLLPKDKEEEAMKAIEKFLPEDENRLKIAG